VEGEKVVFHVEGEMEKTETVVEVCVDAKAGLFHLEKCFDIPHETLNEGHFDIDKTETTPAIPW
jgi:hypothetical protein